MLYRVSHSKPEKVILLWWGHRFWFLLIFWILHVHEIRPFMPSSSVFIHSAQFYYIKLEFNTPKDLIFWIVTHASARDFTVCLKSGQVRIKPDIFFRFSWPSHFSMFKPENILFNAPFQVQIYSPNFQIELSISDHCGTAC